MDIGFCIGTIIQALLQSLYGIHVLSASQSSDSLATEVQAESLPVVEAVEAEEEPLKGGWLLEIGSPGPYMGDILDICIYVYIHM